LKYKRASSIFLVAKKDFAINFRASIELLSVANIFLQVSIVS